MVKFLLRSNERLARSGGVALDQIRVDPPFPGSQGNRPRLVHDQTRPASAMSPDEVVVRPITRHTTVDIAVPVYNESRDLEISVYRLRKFLNDQFPFPAIITIVDNASTDTSWEIAARIARTLPGVRALHIGSKGRGRALRAAWSTSDADIVAYMDVDLSTSLDCLLPLIAPLISGLGDVAIGSRLLHGARVLRGPKREAISRIYNLILRVVLRSHFGDAQCGFKALRAQDARVLLPLVVDNEWFFDTELLVVAERGGLRIIEIAVDWSDDPSSSVHIANTAIKDLQGVWRMLRSPRAGELPLAEIGSKELSLRLGNLLRISRLGALGMSVYVGLFLVLSQFVNNLVANVIALMLSVGLNDIGQRRRLIHSPHSAASRTWAVGPAMLFGALAIATTVTLAISGAIVGRSILAEVLALAAGVSIGLSIQFLVHRGLLFRHYLEHLNQPSDSTDRSRATD